MISFFLNKRYNLIFLAICLFNGVAKAQWFLKPRVGLNYSHMSQPTSVFGNYTDSKIGFQFGSGVEYQFKNRVKLEADLIYTRKGLKDEYSRLSSKEYTLSSHFDYLELPVVAKVSLNSQFSIGGGAYAAYLVHAVHKYQSSCYIPNPAPNTFYSCDYPGAIPIFSKFPQKGFSKTDVGFVLDFSFVTGNFEVGARYNYGFKNVDFTMPNDPEYAGPSKLEFRKNRVLQLYVAYRLEQ